MGTDGLFPLRSTLHSPDGQAFQLGLECCALFVSQMYTEQEKGRKSGRKEGRKEGKKKERKKEKRKKERKKEQNKEKENRLTKFCRVDRLTWG